jgi:hypothetical protein
MWAFRTWQNCVSRGCKNNQWWFGCVILNYILTLNLLTTTIVAPPSNASKWQMGFNSGFKGLNRISSIVFLKMADLSHRNRQHTPWQLPHQWKQKDHTSLFSRSNYTVKFPWKLYCRWRVEEVSRLSLPQPRIFTTVYIRHPPTGTYIITFISDRHWNLYDHMHTNPPLEFILSYSKEPRNWNLYYHILKNPPLNLVYCHIHKNQPMEPIWSYAYEPAIGVYVIIFK